MNTNIQKLLLTIQTGNKRYSKSNKKGIQKVTI
jgi:hypothetical protein